MFWLIFPWQRLTDTGETPLLENTLSTSVVHHWPENVLLIPTLMSVLGSFQQARKVLANKS